MFKFLCVAGCAVLLAGVGGCQLGPSVATRELAEHQWEVEKDGLKEIEVESALKVTCAPPAMWTALPLYKGSLYSHQQWRSPTRSTGVGVVFIHLPIPLPVSTLIWFAKQQYVKHETDGRLMAQWTDGFGRSWFEAENNKYHVKGYAVTSGLDAWIIYSGYKTALAQKPAEIALAERAQETVLVGMNTREQEKRLEPEMNTDKH